MTDLIKRLRWYPKETGENAIMHEAADRIEELKAEAKLMRIEWTDAEVEWQKREDRLKAENERLRGVIIGWREHDYPEWFCRRTAEYLADRARAALEDDQQ